MEQRAHHHVGPARCNECGGTTRLTDGAEVYPYRPDLRTKPIWRCDPCGAYIGCHPGTTCPLGTAAGPETRRARSILHTRWLLPIWREAWRYYNEPDRHVTPNRRRKAAHKARPRVYAFLADRLGLSADECHVGLFTIRQCEAAQRVLAGVTYGEVYAWWRVRRDTEAGSGAALSDSPAAA